MQWSTIKLISSDREEAIRFINAAIKRTEIIPALFLQVKTKPSFAGDITVGENPVPVVTEKATPGRAKLAEGLEHLSPRTVGDIGESSKAVTWADRVAGRGMTKGTS